MTTDHPGHPNDSGATIMLTGIEKKLKDYLTANIGDRYITSNRIALALGAPEVSVVSALKTLIKLNMAVERVDNDFKTTTYYLNPEQPDEPEESVADVEPSKPKKVEVSIKRVIEMPEAESKAIITMKTVARKDVLNYEENGYVRCKLCDEDFGSMSGVVSHLKLVHSLKIDMDAEYAEIDKYIKAMYPKKGPTQIGLELGLTPGIISSRLTKMHKSGEVKGYYVRKYVTVNRMKVSGASMKTQQIIETKPIQQTVERTQPTQESLPFIKIGDLLKLGSECQANIANMVLELTDEKGIHYELIIRRVESHSKGNRLATVTLPIEQWKFIAERAEDDAETLDENDEYMTDVIKECEQIASAVRRDAGIPKEEKKVD